MKGNIEERACALAQYIIENRTTVRNAAKKFGISKSTVHTDVTKQNGPRLAFSGDRFSFRVRRIMVGVFRSPDFCSEAMIK